MKLETDFDGRLLCPECGAGLYAIVEIICAGIPVFTDPRQSLGLDCWDHGEAMFRKAELAALYCASCGFKMPGEDFDEDMVQTRRLAE